MHLLVLSLALHSFANIAAGEALPQRSLSRIGGGSPQRYLGKTKVSVFFFFTPGSKNSQLALQKIAELEKELAGKSVTWVGLVSGGVVVADAQRDVAEAKLAAPVLRDEGDELYGALGAALTPVVGIGDEQHKLLAYLPFTKLQYQDVIRAWVRFGLGEIDKAQLELAVRPPALVANGEPEVAHRYLKLAQKQRERGDLAKALETTRKSLEHAADLPAANAMLGSVLAAQGKCKEAGPALEAALVGEPTNELALATKRACSDGSAGRSAVDAGLSLDAGTPLDAGSPDGGFPDASVLPDLRP